jgi:hypothetical protein
MIPRELMSELQNAAQKYPVVTITGPRQAGKTTLAQMTFPGFSYVNLERPDTRQFAQSDPHAFLERHPLPLIVAEIQRVPDLLSYIQVLVDEKRKNGLFILTGSHQMELQQAITQSLAGRTALLRLLPLTIAELEDYGIQQDLDHLLLQGFLPRLYDQNLNPTKAYRNYFETYIERDLKSLIQVKDLSLFQKFVRLCAGRVGQLLNLNSLANETGVSHHTIEHWLSTLEASFIVIRLQPFYENINKRIVKAPKLYFTEVGLVTYLLGIEDVKQVGRDPLYGNIVENMVVIDFMKMRLNQGLDPNLYFIRDQNGNEIDVIYKQSSKLIPIEIKAAKTFHPEFLKRLKLFQKWVGKRMSKGILVYAGQEEQRIDNIQVINFKNLKKGLL